MKELNKTIQDQKLEVETTKKSERETILKIEKLGKKSVVIDANINNKIQEIEETISGAEDIIGSINSQSKKMQNTKYL